MLKTILDSGIYPGLKYNMATPVFHQWRDANRCVYGIKFETQEDATSFFDAFQTVLEILAGQLL